MEPALWVKDHGQVEEWGIVEQPTLKRRRLQPQPRSLKVRFIELVGGGIVRLAVFLAASAETRSIDNNHVMHSVKLIIYQQFITLDQQFWHLSILLRNAMIFGT